MANLAVRVHAAVAAVAPIDGVSIATPSDKSTWRVDFAPEVTQSERDAAGAVISAIDADAPEVPDSVTPYQARQAINAAGLREAVEAAVAGASYEVKDAWEYALAIERASPFVAAMGSALGLTEQQIDALFISAAGF
jgi:HD-GYP domain-containing protein (c-di-GMP phosphodiesterase class II)